MESNSQTPWIEGGPLLEFSYLIPLDKNAVEDVVEVLYEEINFINDREELSILNKEFAVYEYGKNFEYKAFVKLGVFQIRCRVDFYHHYKNCFSINFSFYGGEVDSSGGQIGTRKIGFNNYFKFFISIFKNTQAKIACFGFEKDIGFLFPDFDKQDFYSIKPEDIKYEMSDFAFDIVAIDNKVFSISEFPGMIAEQHNGFFVLKKNKDTTKIFS